MKISQTYPPNYEKIADAFDIRDRHTVVFTYGDTLYNPGGGIIDEPLLRHEETHAEQQRLMGVEAWWEQYLADNQFRFRQELEAYRIQYSTLRNWGSVQRLRYLEHMAKDLSGPIYGNLMTKDEAALAITLHQKAPTLGNSTSDERKRKKLKRQNKRRGRNR